MTQAGGHNGKAGRSPNRKASVEPLLHPEKQDGKKKRSLKISKARQAGCQMEGPLSSHPCMPSKKRANRNVGWIKLPLCKQVDMEGSCNPCRMTLAGSCMAVAATLLGGGCVTAGTN
eukprot:scaffold208152_cov17-Tisochrysis_lutea.AAC.1